MEKKKLKLSISGSSQKTFSSIEQAKSKSKNTVVIEKKSPKFQSKSQFIRPNTDNFRLNKNKIEEVKTPFTIIAGSNDIMTSKKNSAILNDMLFNSNLEIINNVGHFHPLESPLEVNDIIIKNL